MKVWIEGLDLGGGLLFKPAPLSQFSSDRTQIYREAIMGPYGSNKANQRSISSLRAKLCPPPLLGLGLKLTVYKGILQLSKPLPKSSLSVYTFIYSASGKVVAIGMSRIFLKLLLYSSVLPFRLHPIGFVVRCASYNLLCLP